MIALGYARKAIQQACAGELGRTRVARSGMRHAPARQETERVKALLAPRFDVTIEGGKRHASTPMSFKADRSNWVHDVTIDVTHSLKSPVQDAARADARDAVLDALTDMIQSLTYPGTMSADAEGHLTGIAGGMMLGAEWKWLSEDWAAGLLRTQIKGTVIVQQTQEVAT